MFTRYGRNSKKMNYLAAILFVAWNQLQNADDEEESLWIDGGFLASYFEMAGVINDDWERFGRDLFRLTYDSEVGATDIATDHHVFIERLTGYFHDFQGVRADPGAFLLDSKLKSILTSLPDRMAFLRWLDANSMMSLFHIDRLCFEVGEHHRLEAIGLAKILQNH